MNLIESLLMIYGIFAIPLICSSIFDGYPTYLAQAVFWPIAIMVEIVLSTIRWIKNIKV